MKPSTTLALACAAATLVGGCATRPDGDPSRTTQGAVAGAVIGGLIGAATGNRNAIATGVLAGAALGAVIGNYQDRQIASREEASRRYALASQPRLEVESNVNNPRQVGPGAPVESQVGYTVLAPGHAQNIKVTESRVLVRANERFPLSTREVLRAQGTHLSTLKFTLPRDLPAGNYTLVTTISGATLTRSVEAPLAVG